MVIILKLFKNILCFENISIYLKIYCNFLQVNKTVVHHRDSDPSNNRRDNLSLETPGDNSRYALAIPSVIINEHNVIVDIFHQISTAAEALNVESEVYSKIYVLSTSGRSKFECRDRTFAIMPYKHNMHVGGLC
jgi:hypothetical protein